MSTACGTGTATEESVEPEKSALTETAVEETVAPSQRADEALSDCPDELGSARKEDASSYAEDRDVSDREATRRMRLESCFAAELGALERTLRQRERDSFAGLWIQHELEHRFVVSFTEDGRKKIRPYIRDEPYAPLMVTRSGADATLPELLDAQKRAGRLVDGLGLRVNLGVNVKKNRAEVSVLDRQRAGQRIPRADARLPEHVTLVEVERLMRLS
jgi:hypothetical protein